MEQIKIVRSNQFHYITEQPNLYVTEEQAEEYGVDRDTMVLPRMRALAMKKARDFVNSLESAEGGIGVAPPNTTRWSQPHQFLDDSVRVTVSGVILIKDSADEGRALVSEVEERLPAGDVFQLVWFSRTKDQLIIIEEIDKYNV